MLNEILAELQVLAGAPPSRTTATVLDLCSRFEPRHALLPWVVVGPCGVCLGGVSRVSTGGCLYLPIPHSLLLLLLLALMLLHSSPVPLSPRMHIHTHMHAHAHGAHCVESRAVQLFL